MSTQWQESDSQKFIRYGNHWVPLRREQEKVLLTLLNSIARLQKAVDLCCGQGRLTQAILHNFPEAQVLALDASTEMIHAVRSLNAGNAERLTTQQFRLEKKEWRSSLQGIDAIVSSLAVHHLDPTQKTELFADLYRALNPGGMLVIIDLVLPHSAVGFETAAQQWDDFVQKAAETTHQPEAWSIFRDEHWNWYRYPQQDPYDQPSPLQDQLEWMQKAGFKGVECHFMYAGHAIFSGRK